MLIFDKVTDKNKLGASLWPTVQKHWNNAYLRQGTSYQCRNMDLDPDLDPWTGSPPTVNHLFTGPLPTFLENFMKIRLEVSAQSC